MHTHTSTHVPEGDPRAPGSSHGTSASVVDQVVDRLPLERDQVEAARDQVQALDRQVRTFVRDNPTATVIGAVAVGFLVGRMVTR